MKLNQIQLNTSATRRPKYFAPSAWYGHVPFMFWLISILRPKKFVELGVHHGVSYFSACQAISDFGLQCAAYAVDNWKGDEHSGFYDESVYSSVKKYNDENYRAFSTLIRSDFDAAADGFAPQSIDLLHLDGHHSFESASADFKRWQPLLSETAVVLLHDTNVHERGFGVHRLYESLAAEYRSFDFIHGHGLAVVMVGKETKHRPEYQEIRKICSSKQMIQEARDLFSLLGEAAEDRWKLMSTQEELLRRKKEVFNLRKQIKEASQAEAQA